MRGAAGAQFPGRGPPWAIGGRPSGRLAHPAPPSYLARHLPTRTDRRPGRRLPNSPVLRSPWIAPLALLLAAVSLGANGVLLWKLRRPERLVAPALDRVAAGLSQSNEAIRYTVRIPAGTPVSFDVPIDQRYVVKLRTTLPINTDVRVPFNTPFGNRVVSVPVRSTVPIRQDIPVHLVDTFHLRTRTNTEFVVPLEIKLKDLPLDALRHSLNP
jgi:hypothetical protein